MLGLGLVTCRVSLLISPGSVSTMTKVGNWKYLLVTSVASVILLSMEGILQAAGLFCLLLSFGIAHQILEETDGQTKTILILVLVGFLILMWHYGKPEPSYSIGGKSYLQEVCPDCDKF